MTRKYVWQEAYIAAMLELDPDHLRQRIADARGAMARRLDEMRNDTTESEEERSALHDAQQNLRALMRTLDSNSPRSGE